MRAPRVFGMSHLELPRLRSRIPAISVVVDTSKTRQNGRRHSCIQACTLGKEDVAETAYRCILLRSLIVIETQ